MTTDLVEIIPGIVFVVADPPAPVAPPEPSAVPVPPPVAEVTPSQRPARQPRTLSTLQCVAITLAYVAVGILVGWVLHSVGFFNDAGLYVFLAAIFVGEIVLIVALPEEQREDDTVWVGGYPVGQCTPSRGNTLTGPRP